MADDLGNIGKKVHYWYHCPTLANIQLGVHVAWFAMHLGELCEGWQGPCYAWLRVSRVCIYTQSDHRLKLGAGGHSSIFCRSLVIVCGV